MAAASGVHALDAPSGPMIRGATVENDSSPRGRGAASLDIKSTETSSCGMRCQTNSDCRNGGVIFCGECNLTQGTRYYMTCVGPDTWTTPVPTPASTHNWFPDAGMCQRSCRHDRNCMPVGGTYNPCMTCGQLEGTVMHHQCYAPAPSPAPTPTPEHDYFPDGGECGKSCRHDRDCSQGGFNRCMKCGQYEGSLMHHKCYSPETMME